MNVRELIAVLLKHDPEARVVVEYDAHFFDLRHIEPHEILSEGASWADYPSSKVLAEKCWYPMPAAEREINERSPRETAIVVSGRPI